MNEKKPRYPDFFIVGAAKSGTTSLWFNLGKHPGIFVTNDIRNKELGYFSDDYGVKDLDEYLNYFKNADENQLIGEVCHAYLTSPESAKRIYEANPHAKIIVILRNPVKRAYSLYNFMRMEGYEPVRSFEEALQQENVRKANVNFKNESFHNYYRNYFYFETGQYYHQVKSYLDVFGEDRCKILIFEEFMKDPNAKFDELLEFLTLPTIPETRFEHVNESKSLWFPNIQFNLRFNFPWRIKRFGVKVKTGKKIAALLMKWNTRNKKNNELDPDIYKNLMVKYIDNIQALEKLTTKKLTDIWR